MKKKIELSLLTIITFLNLFLFGLTIWINYENESYIATINQHLADSSAKVQELEQDLSEEKKLRQVANWKLGQIEARDEGIKYQEGDAE